MSIDKMAAITPIKRETITMEVLWGAWATEISDNPTVPNCFDVIGIYDQIYKLHRKDYPFSLDLTAIMSFEASQAEANKRFKINLEMIDLDGTVIFSYLDYVDVPKCDIPNRWYEDYKLSNVIFREPGYYELSILIDNQQKQRIPLWIIAYKASLINIEKDSYTEMWAEDFNIEDL